jgi:hypothetical protein
MLKPRTLVRLNPNILEEDDRSRSSFLFQRLIDSNLTGTVDRYDGERLWVRFPGAAILLEQHNVDEAHELE